jgi:hypothetical protein
LADDNLGAFIEAVIDRWPQYGQQVSCFALYETFTGQTSSSAAHVFNKASIHNGHSSFMAQKANGKARKLEASDMDQIGKPKITTCEANFGTEIAASQPGR